MKIRDAATVEYHSDGIRKFRVRGREEPKRRNRGEYGERQPEAGQHAGGRVEGLFPTRCPRLPRCQLCPLMERQVHAVLVSTDYLQFFEVDF